MIEALDQVRADGAKKNNECWGTRVAKRGGGAYIFLQALEEMEANGEKPNRPSAAKKLQDLFGEDVGDGQLGRHLIKGCSCKRWRDY